VCTAELYCLACNMTFSYPCQQQPKNLRLHGIFFLFVQFRLSVVANTSESNATAPPPVLTIIGFAVSSVMAVIQAADAIRLTPCVVKGVSVTLIPKLAGGEWDVMPIVSRIARLLLAYSGLMLFAWKRMQDIYAVCVCVCVDC
jgi:hypothetical protein